MARIMIYTILRGLSHVVSVTDPYGRIVGFL
jgi:hypothetical protein